MKSHYRVVVIGGGVVGASVIYHLAKLGWSDVCLLERSVLTAGSSWHAAGGIHALNADPNIAALQAYTIDLLPVIEEESGQDIGLHMMVCNDAIQHLALVAEDTERWAYRREGIIKSSVSLLLIISHVKDHLRAHFFFRVRTLALLFK